MPRLPDAKRIEVARLILEGHSYDEVSERSGVSKGSVVGIAEEVKKGKFKGLEHLATYFEEVRDLAVRLRKQGLTVKDAAIGLEAYEKLASLGIEPEDLDRFIRLAEGLESGEYKREEIVQAAVKLMELEEKIGKPCTEAVQELEGLDAKLRQLKEEVSRAEEELTKVKAGLGQLSSLAESFRRLGVSGEELERLLRLAEGLKAAGLKADELEGDVKELMKLGDRVEGLKREVQKLEMEKAMANRSLKDLKDQVLVLLPLRMGYVRVPCRNCGKRVWIENEALMDSMDRGLALEVRCSACDRWIVYTPREVLAQVGLALLNVIS